MGGRCETTDGGLTVPAPARSTASTADLADVSELSPSLAALAALADCPSRLRGIGHIRRHETDRLAALATEINGLGGDVTELPDGLEIRPRPLHGGVFATYDDHRMVMAAAVLGLAVPGVEVENPATVGKTFPEFSSLWPAMLERRALTSRASRRSARRGRRAGTPGTGSRPRTRRRPAHEDAVEGFVVAVDRGRYGVLVDGRRVTAMQARELGRNSVVVGDRSRWSATSPARPDALARVVRVEPRTTVLRRTADDTDPVERIIVANADQLVIVTALADPPPRPRLIDRCLVAAYDAGLAPLLCLTKADLASPDELLGRLRAAGRPVRVIGRK